MSFLITVDWLSAGCGLLVFGGALLIFGQAWKRLRFAQARPPNRASAGSIVRVEGRLFSVDGEGETLLSPLSGTPCLAYCLQVHESRGGQPAPVRVLKHTKKCGLNRLALEDALGQQYHLEIAEFDRQAAEFEDTQNALGPCADPRSAALIADLGLCRNPVGLRRGIDLREHILRAGANIMVIARFEREGRKGHLAGATLTDKSPSRLTLEALPMLLSAFIFLVVALALLSHAFKGP
ncbi:hypothetical protein [Synechococcus sp. CCY9202]|uniref:hypothetical protein n=1 Tax=Synechococcus sp. CCY9202 TaxID=174698 RepID=UPI002B21EC10|nr:hypothetical protein [Synechococcus sp. CCY9202]MEA5424863.1 hypothetical protein [Synechococcus sp. CCY9202]